MNAPMLPPPQKPLKGSYHTRGCAIGRQVTPALDDANRQWLTEALLDDQWPSVVIAAHLSAALERRIPQAVVARHRRGDCSCERRT